MSFASSDALQGVLDCRPPQVIDRDGHLCLCWVRKASAARTAPENGPYVDRQSRLVRAFVPERRERKDHTVRILRNITKVLRRHLPADLFDYCGGVHPDVRLFAGNLWKEVLSEADYYEMTRALITRNAIRKATKHGRNLRAIRDLLARGVQFSEPTHVLDVGASIGLDSWSTYQELSQRYEIDSYTLGDLNTELLYDEERGLIFDQDGFLLQVRRDGYFVSIYFEFDRWYQSLVNIPGRLYSKLLKASLRFRQNGLARIKLVHPSLRADEPGSAFRLRRIDLFKRIGGEYHIILCFHLLTDRYFSSEERVTGVQNLKRCLKDDGLLILGGRDFDYEIIRKGPGALACSDPNDVAPRI